MKKILGVIFIASLFLGFCAVSRCENVNIQELVDQYKHATDLQKQELDRNFIGKRITGSGIVENVGEYDFFDISNDTGGKYYKVLALQQETANKVPYQLIFLYKEKDRVKDINRGERIEKESNIMKIIDERLQIAVWIYDGELTSRELDLFK
jgi:hypothetical protein